MFVRKMIKGLLFENEPKPDNGAGFFIFDVDGKLLITHPTGEASGPNIWSIPKGKKEVGETDLDAAYREVKEETSLDLKAMKGNVTKIGMSTYTSSYGPVKNLMMFAFRATEPINGKHNVVCTSMYNGKPENDQNKWATREEAMQLLAPYQREVLSKIKE